MTVISQETISGVSNLIQKAHFMSITQKYVMSEWTIVRFHITLSIYWLVSTLLTKSYINIKYLMAAGSTIYYINYILLVPLVNAFDLYAGILNNKDIGI